MSRVMQWIDEELARDPKLTERVEAELARLRLEQDSWPYASSGASLSGSLREWPA